MAVEADVVPAVDGVVAAFLASNNVVELTEEDVSSC